MDGRTALLATCRVYFTSGYIQDVKALTEIAHRLGALCLVDDYQGAGQIPIDVREADVDFLVTGGLKWLIGGPGVAYLYVRKELIPQLEPRPIGWFAHQRQFDFAPYSLELRSDARRFEAGTPAVAVRVTAGTIATGARGDCRSLGICCSRTETVEFYINKLIRMLGCRRGGGGDG